MIEKGDAVQELIGALIAEVVGDTMAKGGDDSQVADWMATEIRIRIVRALGEASIAALQRGLRLMEAEMRVPSGR